jgi:hypothetical protein
MRSFKQSLCSLGAVGFSLFVAGGALAGEAVAPASWETNDNTTSSMSFGAWVATGTAKLRLALVNWPDGVNTFQRIFVYTTGNVDKSSCTIRSNHTDGSGSNHPFDTNTPGTGFMRVSREANFSIGSGDFLEAECLLQNGDAIHGADYNQIFILN